MDVSAWPVAGGVASVDPVRRNSSLRSRLSRASIAGSEETILAWTVVWSSSELHIDGRVANWFLKNRVHKHH